MKNIKISNILIIIWGLHFIIYNTYFGWNLKPINDYEVIQDLISRWIFYIAIMFYLLPVFKLYEHAVNEFEKNKKYQDIEDEQKSDMH